MTKATLKKAAQKLREARDLMNSGGKHWIKGTEKAYVPKDHTPGSDDFMSHASGSYKVPAYCSIGAIREVGARDSDVALITLAEIMSPSEVEAYREEIVAEYDHELTYYGSAEDFGETKEAYVQRRLAAASTDIIVGYNDDELTKWDDVRSAFTKAAKRLADRAGRAK